jgi:serine/threonine-protein kinase
VTRAFSVTPLALAPSGEPERIGPWLVRGVLGRGGMGVVYEVVAEADVTPHAPTPAPAYALKTVERRFLDVADAAAEQRFAHEIKILKRLDHPGIVRLYDFGAVEHPLGYELAYYVMERLHGDTLVPTIKAGLLLPLREVLGIGRRLLEAIIHLDAHGILHRDLKPGNVFLERTGRVVLLDFGLARAEELTRLTLAGQIVGTFSYMAPERLAGLPLTVAADVFSLGIVLFQLVAGRHPFGAGTPPDLMASIHRGITWRDDDPPALDDPELRRLFVELLAPRAERRPSPDEVLRRLAALEARARGGRGRDEEQGTELIPVGPEVHGRTVEVPAMPEVLPLSPLSGPSPTEAFPPGMSMPPMPASRGAGPTPRAASASPRGGVTHTLTVADDPRPRGPGAASGTSGAASATSATSDATATSGSNGAAGLAVEPAAPRSASIAPTRARQPASRGATGPSRLVLGLVGGSILCLGFTLGLVVGTRRGRPSEAGATAYVSGVRALAEGRLDDAQKGLEHALRENPDLVDAYRALSDVAVLRGDAGEAAAQCARYLARRPAATDRAACEARLGPAP